MDKELIEVAAGIIRNNLGQIYLTQRLEGKDFAQLFEFPGGKINKFETPEQALKRELEEEIGICVQNISVFDQFLFEYPTKIIYFYFYLVTDWVGEPFGREGQRGFWLNQSELDATLFPPANAKVIKRLLMELNI